MLKVHLVGSNHRMRVQMTSPESPKRNSVQMGAWKCHTLCFERCTIYITHLSRHTHHMHTPCFRRFQWRHLDAHAVIGSHQMNLASADWRWGFIEEDLMCKCWLLISKKDFSWCLLLPVLWTGFLTKRNKKSSEFSKKISYQVVAIVYSSLKLHYKCSIPFSHWHFCIWPGNVNCNDIYSFTCFEIGLSETLMWCNLCISNIAKIDLFLQSIPASPTNVLLQNS